MSLPLIISAVPDIDYDNCSWSRIVTTLCDPGEIIITEEWTYPSAMVSARPFGIGVLPVSMDGQGMRADSLRDTLASWDERKGKRFIIMINFLEESVR